MPNSNLVQLIKRIAVEAIDARKPCDYVVGKVTRISPLRIRMAQNMVLNSDFLLLTKSVADDGGNSGLKKGDMVLMFRKQGGQQYVVIDKVVKE